MLAESVRARRQLDTRFKNLETIAALKLEAQTEVIYRRHLFSTAKSRQQIAVAIDKPIYPAYLIILYPG